MLKLVDENFQPDLQHRLIISIEQFSKRKMGGL